MYYIGKEKESVASFDLILVRFTLPKISPSYLRRNTFSGPKRRGLSSEFMSLVLTILLGLPADFLKGIHTCRQVMWLFLDLCYFHRANRTIHNHTRKDYVDLAL